MTSLPTPSLIDRIEELAVELAQLAGAEITSALRREIAVRYKGEDSGAFRDPVSEVDQKVEDLIRSRLAEQFPDHGIIGEEVATDPDPSKEIVWAVDPIDGTANFVNGFPMFAGSIGVLHRGWPLVGAVWCSTSHLLRPGVYHAQAGSELRFDHERAEPRSVPARRRHLIGEPVRTEGDFPWDFRQTGSAAIECAFVAAGLLRATRFRGPNIWDVAGGAALVAAAGGIIRHNPGDGWRDFDRFIPPERGLRHWRGSLLMGEREAIDLLSAAHPEG